MGIFEHDFDLFVFKDGSHHRPFRSAIVVHFIAECNHQSAHGVDINIYNAVKFGYDLNRSHICEVVAWWVHRTKICEEMAHWDNGVIKSVALWVSENFAENSIVFVPCFVIKLFIKHCRPPFSQLKQISYLMGDAQKVLPICREDC